MRLITGPAGSGKTTFLLDRFREALRARDYSVRLLVPTATMAQHLENQIAREGLVFRRGLIQTLSRFVDDWATDFPQAPQSVLYLLVEEAVGRVNRPEFRRVARLPGFCASLARTIEEFSSAGCDSARLAGCLPEAPLASAFLAVYEEVDRLLDRRGLLLRAKRLEYAAARIHSGGLSNIQTVLLNGFHTLPDPELAVIQAIALHADITIALAEDTTEAMRDQLVAMGFREDRFQKSRASGAVAIVRARNIEREVEEIARRILDQAGAGRPFREMGILVRSAETYVPLLGATLERFGIPARFYFETDTQRQPAIRFLAGAVDAMLGGWDHAATLKVLRLAPRFADSAALDRLDFQVREQIPGSGHGELRALAGNEESPLVRLLDSLRELEEWRSFEMTPADWSARFRTLRNLFRPARPQDGEDRSLALQWRSQAATLKLLDEVFEEAAMALDSQQLIQLPAFWRAVKSVLRLRPLRVDDGRRNVVHVLSAHEARQWVLPVVYVCGMVERQFPRFHPQDTFFPDAARYALNRAGIRVRTTAEFEREERALFDSALARAKMLATLTYPQFDARGETLLPSRFLEDRYVPIEDARAVRPRPRYAVGKPAASAIHTPALLSVLQERATSFSATGLDAFLQCPFQYFGTRLLRLKTAPLRPDERLDFLTRGNIVHEVLAQWYAHPRELSALFESVFNRVLKEKHIQDGYHTERLRNAILQDLERFVIDEKWPRDGFTTQTEQPFDFVLRDGITLKGRIDRIDTRGDGSAYIIDYKYSAAQRVKEKKNDGGLQAPLYLLSAEKAFGVRPVGMFFVGLKGVVQYTGWSDDGFLDSDSIPADWRDVGDRVLSIVKDIRSGRIVPAPADTGSCFFCDARDVCRIDTVQTLVAIGENGVSVVPFTADQLMAIDATDRHRDACIVAGPGSGKTTVLVEYFGRLVAAGVDPLRILSITFTEKAAANMRAKLARAFRENSGLRTSLERAWVSTVHGFCGRLLRENAISAGIDPEFYIADERESWRLQQESIAAAMAEVFREHPAPVRALIRGLSSWEFEEALLSAYDAMRGAGMPVDELAALPAPPSTSNQDVADILRAFCEDQLAGWTPKQRCAADSIKEEAARIVYAKDPLETLAAIEGFSKNLPGCKRNTTGYRLVQRLQELIFEELPYTAITELYQQERALLLDIIRRFDRIYRERKRAAGALDFADLEEYAVRLLSESQETRTRLQNQFDFVLMDELQDTNGEQAKLLALIRRPGRFYAVGDINQSIFGFRHAEPEVFQRYRESVARGGRLIELRDNFRSRPDILRLIETVSANAPGIEPHSLVAGRVFSDERPVAVEVLSVTARDTEEALRNEASWVARRVLELVGTAEEQFAFRDVAVLVRNTEVLSEFTQAFDDIGVPYVVNRGRGFYEAREVKDLVHLLRVIANPRDEISLATVLRSPLVQVSDEALLSLRSRNANIGAALAHLESKAELGPDDYEKLIRFRERLHRLRLRREHTTFDQLLIAALDDCGYTCESATRGWANIEKFLAQARQAALHMSLDEFVEELDLVRASNPREPDAAPEDAADAVNVMTIHSAKGLEFPIVFVAALHKGVETSPPVIAFSREYGLGARWRNPADGKDKDDLFQHAIREERKVREIAEGNRLLYVAMSRAEQHLVMSFSGAGKKLEHWAKTISEQLHLDVQHPTDEILTQQAPNGEQWKMRLLVAHQPPERLARSWEMTPAAETVDTVIVPKVTDQYDANATVTAVAAFAKCPRRYYLGHYLGFEGRPRKLENAGELSAGEFGTQVHTLLRGMPVENPEPQAQVMATVFHRSPLGRRVSKASHVEREFDFLMAVEGLVLRGQIDLWFEEGGELVIVDYKTDAVNAVEAHQRAQDYAIQLRLYASAVERITGRPPDRAYLHFLRPDTVLEIDLTPSLLDSPEQIVRDFQHAQDTLEFPVNEGSHCQACPFYRDLCPAKYPKDHEPHAAIGASGGAQG